MESQVPLNFEFEFEFKKRHDDISIFPMKGIIPGMAQTEVEVKFTPMSKTTAFAEVVLKISQFGFKPIITKIMGSAKSKEVKPVRKSLSRSMQRKGRLDPLDESR